MAYIGVSPSNGVRRVHTYTATASQTTFSGAGAEGTSLSYKDSNFVDVYQNGVKLGDADYTATSGTSIVLGTGATASDLVVIVVFDVFSVADTVSKADGGTFDNPITITTDDNNPQLTLTSTDADASVGPVVILKRDSASPADDDALGFLKFDGENDASEQTTYASINARSSDVTDGTEDGKLDIFTIQNGSTINRQSFIATETVFNEDSADVDFRVESNGNANMFVVDGGNDNVGIGGTGNPTLYVVNSNAGPGLTAANATAVFHGSVDSGKGGCIGFDFGASHTNYPVGIGYIITSQTASTTGDLGFFTRSGTGDDAPSERMRITSAGNIKVATSITPANLIDTSNGEGLGYQSGDFLAICRDGGATLHLNRLSSNGEIVTFRRQASSVGNVTVTTTGTTYNTSSDYRLKENIVTEWDATTRLKQLKPSRFNFKTDKDVTVDGFIAHEVSSIVPEAITGEKDGTQDLGTIKDAEGNILKELVLESVKKDGQTWTKTKTENIYQSIDQSKLVPLLTKTLQEALTRIDTLETEVKALKGE